MSGIFYRIILHEGSYKGIYKVIYMALWIFPKVAFSWSIFFSLPLVVIRNWLCFFISCWQHLNWIFIAMSFMVWLLHSSLSKFPIFIFNCGSIPVHDFWFFFEISLPVGTVCQFCVSVSSFLSIFRLDNLHYVASFSMLTSVPPKYVFFQIWRHFDIFFSISIFPFLLFFVFNSVNMDANLVHHISWVYFLFNFNLCCKVVLLPFKFLGFI